MATARIAVAYDGTTCGSFGQSVFVKYRWNFGDFMIFGAIGRRGFFSRIVPLPSNVGSITFRMSTTETSEVFYDVTRDVPIAGFNTVLLDINCELIGDDPVPVYTATDLRFATLGTLTSGISLLPASFTTESRCGFPFTVLRERKKHVKKCS